MAQKGAETARRNPISVGRSQILESNSLDFGGWRDRGGTKLGASINMAAPSSLKSVQLFNFAVPALVLIRSSFTLPSRYLIFMRRYPSNEVWVVVTETFEAFKVQVTLKRCFSLVVVKNDKKLQKHPSHLLASKTRYKVRPARTKSPGALF